MAAVMRADAEQTTAHADEVTTRARLVEAAAEVFAEQGFDRARVQEIARRAGMTTGAIYANFTGKGDLLVEAIDQASTPEIDRLMGERGLSGSAPEILVRMGESITDARTWHGEQLLFEAIVAARRDSDVAAMLSRQIEAKLGRFEALVALGKAEGSIVSDVDADSVAKLSMSIALGFLILDLLGIGAPSRAGWEDVIDRIVGTIAITGPGDEGKPDGRD